MLAFCDGSVPLADQKSCRDGVGSRVRLVKLLMALAQATHNAIVGCLLHECSSSGLR